MARLFRRHRKSDSSECAEVHELLSDYLDAELDPDRRRRVDDHVGFCPRCRQVLTNLRQTLGGLSRLGEKPRATGESEEVAERLLRSWRDRA